MENHDHNGHGESHDDHATEGNRQYYPKGWWVPLVGLVVVAFGFTVIGYYAFKVSGTDKWGKQECEMHDGHGTGHGDGHGEKAECCEEGKPCDHHKDGHGDKKHHDANPNDAHQQADTTHGANAPHAHDTTKPADHDHNAADGHHH